MSARTRYPVPGSFRAELQRRLRAEARVGGVPLSRLRKEAAFNRLLARLVRVVPRGWALKGGLALVARVGPRTRGTSDADANWRATSEDLEDALTGVEDIDLDDWFTFEVVSVRAMRGESVDGVLRYPVTARLDGRVFERFSLDVNLIDPLDSRPVELVAFRRNPFEFVDEPPLEIPMVTPAQQLAEKLHAYLDVPHGRAKDLFDMLLIADRLPLPDAAELGTAVEHTFQVRATAWPPQLTEPPADWSSPWASLVAGYPSRWPELSDAFVALRQFWEPILTGSASGATWRPSRWCWSPDSHSS